MEQTTGKIKHKGTIEYRREFDDKILNRIQYFHVRNKGKNTSRSRTEGARERVS